MPEWISEVLNMIYSDLILPVISIIIVVILNRLSTRANKVLESADDKNRKEAISAVTNITSQAMLQLDTVVSSAVAYTMRLADAYKADDTPKLTDEEIKELNDQARELAYKMLPIEILAGSLTTILGGEEAIRTMIDSSIEKQIISNRSSQ